MPLHYVLSRCRIQLLRAVYTCSCAPQYTTAIKRKVQQVARWRDSHGALKELESRRKDHICCLMFAQSKNLVNLVIPTEGMVLRNTNKVKFECKRTDLTKVLESTFYRGVSLWNRLSEQMQKSLTKVKI